MSRIKVITSPFSRQRLSDPTTRKIEREEREKESAEKQAKADAEAGVEAAKKEEEKRDAAAKKVQAKVDQKQARANGAQTMSFLLVLLLISFALL